jgi:tRNA pseudouridine38-40 synthase
LKKVEGPRGNRFEPSEGEVNLRITLSYQGQSFQGYQSQPHGKTVQDFLNQAWELVSKGQKPTLFGCSRLDAGVHAKHFVLNLYSTRFFQSETLLMRNLNGILHSHLKVPICIERLEICEPKFNARFDAVGKHYRYLLWYGFEQHAHHTPRCWQIKSRNCPHELSLITPLFLGTKDFSAYRASDCSSQSTVRNIRAIHTWVHPRLPQLTVIDFWGEGFLKNMVRNIVGTMVDTSLSKFTTEQITSSFTETTRASMGQCAPAHALSLEKVYYDAAEFENDAHSGVSLFL